MTNPTEPAPFSVGDRVTWDGTDLEALVIGNLGEWVELLTPPTGDKCAMHSSSLTLIAHAVYAPPEMADPIVVSRAALREELGCYLDHESLRPVPISQSCARCLADAALRRLEGGAQQ